jgi:hypothetical protein
MKLEPPPHLKALLDAYIEVAGLPITLSYERARVLTELHDRGFTPEDVRLVLGKLKRLIASGTKGYTDASLDFRNAIGDVDKFEERAIKIRQERLRRRGAVKQPDVPQTRALPDGSRTTVLAPAPPARDPAEIAAEVRRQAEEFRRKMGRSS